MSNRAPQEETMILNGQIKLPYTWTVGLTGSRFLTELRDRQLGKKDQIVEKKIFFEPLFEYSKKKAIMIPQLRKLQIS